MSVATLQAIEDRGYFYRLDCRLLLSPFVLTLVHLGKDILTQATFGAGDAVIAGRRAQDLSVIEPLQPVSLPLGFVLSELKRVSDLLCDVPPAWRPRCCDSYLNFFAVLYFWYILISGADNLVCFDPFIISTNTSTKETGKRENYIIRMTERSSKTLSHATRRAPPPLKPTRCCDTNSPNSERKGKKTKPVQ